MHSKHVYTGRHSVIAGKDHLLGLVPENTILFEDSSELLGRTEHVVVVGISHIAEGDIDTSGNATARNVRNGDRAGSREATVATRVDAGSLQLSLVVIDHSLLHLVYICHKSIVRIEVKGATADRRGISSLQIVLLRLPTDNATIHHVNVDILIEDTKHEPGSSSTVNSLTIVKNYLIAVTNTQVLNSLSENLGFGELLNLARSPLADNFQIKELSSREVLLRINTSTKISHTAMNSDLECLLGEM